jgi:hypothetical protein
MRKYGKANKKELGNKKIIAGILLCICMTAWETEVFILRQKIIK